jgi:hypothetical protein
MSGCASAARLIAKNLSVSGSHIGGDGRRVQSSEAHEIIAIRSQKSGECRRDEEDAAKRLRVAGPALAGLIPAVNLLVAIGKKTARAQRPGAQRSDRVLA